MSLIEFLYSLSASIALIACIPQLRQLIATKRSEEFSLQTWVLWTATQSVTLVYTISIHNVLMITVNILWVSFYALMTYLIFHYGYLMNVSAEPAPVPAPKP